MTGVKGRWTDAPGPPCQVGVDYIIGLELLNRTSHAHTHRRIRSRTMSPVLPCTRATVQRVAFRTTQCKRFASSEAVAMDAGATMPAMAPSPAAHTAHAGKSVSEQMSRLLYPNSYARPVLPRAFVGQKKVRTKEIDEKWKSTMQKARVRPGQSMYMLGFVFHV